MRKRILVVDRDDVMLEVLGEMLGEMGFDSTTEKSGSSAAAMLLDGGEIFHLILADLTAAEAAELQFIETALSIRPAVPVVLVTVSWGDLTEEAAKAKGISKLLYKPFTKRELSGALREAL
jgi:CheY-like chemotaxis protein